MTDDKEITTYTMYYTCDSGIQDSVDIKSTSLQEAVNRFYDTVDNFILEPERFNCLDNIEYTKNGKIHDVVDVGLLST